MITGAKKIKIKQYLPIDHLGEGYGFVAPQEGQEFIGIPYQWVAENSIPFIEIRENGVAIKSINALDLAEIEYEI